MNGAETLDRRFADQIESYIGNRIDGVQPLSSSMAGPTVKLVAGDRSFFVKIATSQRTAEAIRAEADGLRMLREACPDHVAEVVGVFSLEDDTGCALVLDWIEAAPKRTDYSEKLAVALHMIHSLEGARFGLESDNFIGSTDQINTPADSWPEFFAERRLGRQRTFLVNAGRWRDSWTSPIDALLARLDDLLPADPDASLLHGDLWSGNAIVGSSGGPVLIDPAVYYGHYETDLAMMKCFGGFSERFFDAYSAHRRPAAGLGERIDIYNLYHLLNHVLLFGGGYAGRVESILRKFS